MLEERSSGIPTFGNAEEVPNIELMGGIPLNKLSVFNFLTSLPSEEEEIPKVRFNMSRFRLLSVISSSLLSSLPSLLLISSSGVEYNTLE